MGSYRFDVLIIGTGEAGSTAASILSAAGLKTAIADKNPFGGTCALRGCNPKRTLAGAAEVLYRAACLAGKGVAGKVHINWSELISFVEELIQPIPPMNEQQFARKGIRSYHGEFSFVGTNSMSNGKDTIEADKIILATGSRSRPIGIPGEKYVTDSETFLYQKELPRSVVLIGAGYISFEFAHVLARAGSAVTIIEATQYPLVHFDRDLVSMLLKATEELGIQVLTGAPVQGIEKIGNVLRLHANNTTYDAITVIHGAGRVPDLGDLDLQNGNVVYDTKGVVVNEFLQSVSNQAVYVAGDAHAQGIQLTTVAEKEGETVAENILNHNTKKPDYRVVPSVVFTLPGLASVGMREEEAKKAGIAYRVHHVDTSKKHISWRHGFRYSAFKILEEIPSGRLLGAHLLGHAVDEIINVFSLAIRNNLRIADLKDAVWTFPSVMYDTVSRIRVSLEEK